jgi:hypothetical protein
VLVLGALAPLPAAQPQKADGGARQHINWFLPALIERLEQRSDGPPRALGVHDAWKLLFVLLACGLVWSGGASNKQQEYLNRKKSPEKIARTDRLKKSFMPKRSY